MIEENAEEKSDDFGYLSNVNLYIKHPVVDPKEITRELGVEPRFSWIAGSQRVAPNGQKLTGVNKESYWSYTTDWFYERHFSKKLLEILDLMETRNEYVRKLTDSFGVVILSINLSGKTNIGDVIMPGVLSRMANLSVRLGIEVFPHMRH